LRGVSEGGPGRRAADQRPPRPSGSRLLRATVRGHAQPHERGARSAGPHPRRARAPAAHPRERHRARGHRESARGLGPRRGAARLAACPAPDILVNNAGGPPPGDFREWDRDTWVRALDANMITPILLIKATVDGMIARRFGRVVNITSSAVKRPIDILGLSNGARTGLTGFVAGLARKTVADNVTINNLL